MISFLINELHTNPIFTGAMSVSIFASMMYWIKDLPKTIYRKIHNNILTTITFKEHSQGYDHIIKWIAPKLNNKFTRHYNAIDTAGSNNNWWSHEETEIDWTLGVGYGKFWLFYDKCLFLVSHSISSDLKGKNGASQSTLSISTFGLSRKRIDQILQDSFSDQIFTKTIAVYLWGTGIWGDSYTLVERRKFRSLDTVVLAKGFKEDMISDIERFSNSEDLYIERGIPYRRGYLFAGLPGTGKSSIAFALASNFKKPIYCINLSSVKDDNNLFNAMSKVPDGSILLLEDIDATKVAESRLIETDSTTKVVTTGVSLSGLLNSIDGVFAKEGRLLIMTTNHPENLDAALLRPGRVDRRFDFGYSDKDQVIQLLLKFFPNDIISLDMISKYADNKTASTIQSYCLQFSDLETVLEQINT